MQNAHFESHIIGFTFVRRALFNVFLLFFFFFSNFAWRKVTEEIFFFYISVFFLWFHFISSYPIRETSTLNFRFVHAVRN